MENINFKQIFKQISAQEMNENIFALLGNGLAGKGFIITAGRAAHYNSMVGSGGGFGLLFRKPAIWCVIKSDRYTLELIEKEQTYTFSYLPDEFQEQIKFLGNTSGRASQKMQETELTAAETPSGNIAFAEAKMVIECSLQQITTPNPEDFYSQQAKDYLKRVYREDNDIRRYVFGEITNIWIKN